MRRAGAREVRVEDVPFRDGYARTMLGLDAIASLAGLVALRRGRSPLAAVAATAAAALIADDVSNLSRVWRRLTTRPRTTTNVVAEGGDPDSERTLVVLAHHDAAPTGLIFDQRPQRWVARRFPSVVASRDESLPLWWPA